MSEFIPFWIKKQILVVNMSTRWFLMQFNRAYNEKIKTATIWGTTCLRWIVCAVKRKNESVCWHSYEKLAQTLFGFCQDEWPNMLDWSSYNHTKSDACSLHVLSNRGKRNQKCILFTWKNNALLLSPQRTPIRSLCYPPNCFKTTLFLTLGLM